ncbi:MAG: hypothetical protein WCY49_05945 [Anaerovoracaceae bacterium]
MAFSLFKKRETADIIFANGKIYTLDNEEPVTSGVCIKDDKVLAVGDSQVLLEEFLSDDTLTIDLEGKVLTPGMIKAPSNMVMDVFKSSMAFLQDKNEVDEILAEIKKHLEDKEGFLGYGLKASLLKNTEPEKFREILDGISPDKPILLITEGGFQVLLNTISLETAKAQAEEEGVLQITLPYVINVLGLVDYDKVLEEVLKASKEYCKRGYTSVLNLNTPDYFSGLFNELLVTLYQEGFIKQRFYGSLLVDKDVNNKSLLNKLLHNKTLTNEMEGLVNFTTLHLRENVSEEEDYRLSKERLEDMILSTSERGFNIFVEADTDEFLEETITSMDKALSKGFRKSRFTIMTDLKLTADLEEELSSLHEIVIMPREDIKAYKTMEEFLHKKIREPYLLISDEPLIVEEGAKADFTIFDKEPNLDNPKVIMTMLNGDIVYEKDDDQEDWFLEFQELHHMMEEE